MTGKPGHGKPHAAIPGRITSRLRHINDYMNARIRLTSRIEFSGESAYLIRRIRTGDRRNLAKNIEKTPGASGKDDVAEFLRKVAATPVQNSSGRNGRLIFAIDATASRQPTWDQASHLQHEMFEEAAAIGGLELQVAFFRGFGEFRATRWTTDSKALIRPMSRVFCLGGHTQIEKVLNHALSQTKKDRINALVYVGDCMEEDADHLCHLAGQLGMLKVPVFVFQEGHDRIAENCFRQIAKLSGGAYCRFDSASAAMLRTLLRAVAAYAAGGRKALSDFSKKSPREATLLLEQIK